MLASVAVSSSNTQPYTLYGTQSHINVYKHAFRRCLGALHGPLVQVRQPLRVQVQGSECRDVGKILHARQKNEGWGPKNGGGLVGGGIRTV
jgi:hypothetical protein